MAIIARATRTITDLFDPIQQGTAPVSPVTGMLWLDTGVVPPILKQWNGSAWISVGLTPEDLQKVTPFIASTHTISTASWTGNAPFPALAHGQQITYLLQQVPTGSATLNLTLSGGGTTGGINCYYSGATRLTTHYSQGNVIRLTYLENNKVSSSYYTGWWADANYDSNTYDRILYNRAILAKSAIAAARLIVSDSAGYFHLAAGAVFDIDKPILYAGSAIASGAAGTNNYTAFYQVPLTNNFTGVSFTNYKSIYLKGQLAGMQFTVSATTPVTDSPTDEAGAVYMHLGQAYSTTQITLPSQHELYMFNRGVLKSFAQIAAEVEVRVTSAEQKITPDAIVSTVRSSSEYLADLAGKNRTWLQSTAPTGAAVGDLWIDTANGNLLKRWNGSSWANVQDAAVSIAQQTADKISWIVASGSSASNMTLTSQLYSLVSQNVVISADNLTATARDILKLEAAEAIQVGGTNYYNNEKTLIPYTVPGYTTALNVSERNTGDVVYGFAVTGSNPSGSNNLRILDVIDSDGPWTVSFDLRGTQSTMGSVSVDICDLANIPVSFTNDNKFVRHSITVNVTNHDSNPTIYSFIDFQNFEYKYYRIRNIKVEKGNKATDWTPALADITDRMDAAELKITPEAITSTVKTGIGYTGTNLNTDLSNKANTSALASYSTLTQTSNSITAAVSGVVPAVRNYVMHSNVGNGVLAGWAAYGTASLYANPGYVAVVYGGARYDGMITYTNLVSGEMVSGETYTLTILIGGRGSTTSISCAVASSYFTIPMSSAIQSIDFTFTASSGMPNYIQFYCDYVPSAGEGFNVFWFIITKGTNPPGTHFPAPEDPVTRVKTSYISIDSDSIDISSGGKINLTSVDSIFIGSSPLSVGGTNLCPYSSFVQGHDGGADWSPKVYYNSPHRIIQKTIPALPNTTYTIKIWTTGYLGWVQETGQNWVVKTHSLPPAGTAYTFTTIINTDNIEVTLAKVDDSNLLPTEALSAKVKLEKGTLASDWSPHPDDPAKGVKTSYITIDSDSIDIASGGKLNLASADDLIVSSGTSINMYVNSKIADVIIGGTNLIRNSTWLDGATAWSGGGDTAPSYLSSIHENGVYYTGVLLSSSSSYSQITQYIVNVKPSTTYTYSLRASTNGMWMYAVEQKSDGSLTASYVDHGTELPMRSLNAAPSSVTFITQPDCTKLLLYCRVFNGFYAYIAQTKLETGNKATDWSIAPEDPVQALKSSFISIDSDSIDIVSGGNVNINAGANFNVRAGSSGTALGISNNESNGYMMWAGNATPASAPFSVKMNGNIIAKNLSQLFTIPFTDMGNPSLPAECYFYVPSGYNVDYVLVAVSVKKYRAYTTAGITEPMAAPEGFQLNINGYLYSNYSSTNSMANADVTNMVHANQWNVISVYPHSVNGKVVGSAFVKMTII